MQNLNQLKGLKGLPIADKYLLLGHFMVALGSVAVSIGGLLRLADTGKIPTIITGNQTILNSDPPPKTTLNGTPDYFDL